MKTIHKFLLLQFFIFVLVGDINATPVSKCQLGEGPLPDEVDVMHCETDPCIFYINGNSTMTMRFKSPKYVEHFAPNALALALGLKIPYPLQQDDGCVGVTNTPCPLADQEFVEYSYSMFILPIFPKIAFTLEFSLVDTDTDQQLECFRINIQLEDLPGN